MFKSDDTDLNKFLFFRYFVTANGGSVSGTEKMEIETVTNLSQRIVEFILTRNDEDLAKLSRKKIAQTFDMELSGLSRKFEQDIDLNIDQFISREKIYRAMFAIERNHDISSHELSVKLGFRKYKNFSTEFSNTILIKPDQYIDLKRK